MWFGVVKSPAPTEGLPVVSQERSATIDRQDVRAAADIIRRAIADADGPLPPAFLIEFLIRDWRRYLAAVHHKAGPRSIVLKDAEALTNRLLLSVLPADTRESRDTLMKGLPRLVLELKAGMVEAAIEPERREQFLGELRSWHLGLLEAPIPTSAPPQADLSETVAMNVFDPRYRELLDRLDGLDSVEHIEM